MTAIHSNCQDEQLLITARECKNNTNISSHTETVIYNPFTFRMQVHKQRPTHREHARTNNTQTLKANRGKKHFSDILWYRRIFKCYILLTVSHFIPSGNSCSTNEKYQLKMETVLAGFKTTLISLVYCFHYNYKLTSIHFESAENTKIFLYGLKYPFVVIHCWYQTLPKALFSLSLFHCCWNRLNNSMFVTGLTWWTVPLQCFSVSCVCRCACVCVTNLPSVHTNSF